MKQVAAFQIARVIGWVAIATSAGVVLTATFIESIPGPLPDQSIWPTPRLWSYFRTTLWMAALATIIAFAIATPLMIVLANLRPGLKRRILLILIILPLVTMPSIHAYAWLLLATRKDGFAAAFLNAIGWNTPGAQPFQSAVVLAAWLWPIPALVLSVAFRQMGRQGYLLARLDAGGLTAFLRDAHPLMRASLIAAASATFILACTDATIPPLMGVTEVWSVEMLAAAAVASSRVRPIGYLFWQSWPMLLLIAALALAAIPGIRRMTRWGEELESPDIGLSIGGGGGSWLLACVLAVVIALYPLMVFATEFTGARVDAATAMQTALKTFGKHGAATFIVAIITGLCAMAGGLSVIDDHDNHLVVRALSKIAFVTVLITAILPPEIIGTALASTFARISDPAHWNIYDSTPWAWIAAMLSRFAVVTVVVTVLANRRVPDSLLAQAQLEGARGTARSALVRLPFIWRSIAVAAILTACIATSEIGASVLTQPVRFFGGSLAVQVDMQMHYGRQDETTFLAAIMLVPALLAALSAPALARRRTPA